MKILNLTKHTEEKLVKLVLLFFALLIVFILSSILWGIFSKGIPVLSWEMLSQVPQGGYFFGKGGGILNAIVGSIYLAMGASALAVLISIPSALYIHTYLYPKPKTKKQVRFFLDVLWGVPPVVYGAFGFTIMLFMGWQSSLWAGIITVGILISPIMIRAMDETFQNLPSGLFETASALGFYKGEIGFKFLLKQAAPGIATAFLMAFGKGIGDTAAILFVNGYTDYVSQSLSEPAATLPLAIFFQLSSPIAEVKNRAFAAAIVLTMIILVISLISRFISKKLSKNKVV